ncbi:competence type IV pilus assembly protein ComGB [Pediococcus inopinatus]|nr:competence type IV pilus assembly protein ComGB [Pediococcus inopinatus]WPC20603.1 competence type IV pilus assembly protein ComGB [Pediococcus inopinatus]WPP10189.1 competence type IV pilus assembly protein ComGB [Pediococcus inopinatus]
MLLADLLRVGFSLGEALNFIKVIIPRKAKQIDQIIATLEHGDPFSMAIKPFLNENIYYQVLISEKHGDLSVSLQALGTYLTAKQKQQTKLLQLLEYPFLLLTFLGALLVGMKIYIFPELSLWNSATQVHKIKFSNVLIFIALVTLIGCLYIYIKRFLKKPIVKRVEVICRIPIVGNVYRTYCHYYLSLNLAMLLKSGLGIKSICAMLANFSSTSLLYQIGTALEKQLSEGRKTSSFVKRYPFIPEELNVLMNKGNTAEGLGQELVMFSKIKYQKLTKQIERLIGLIQPLMFLLIGLVIVLMYLSMLLPMYHSMEGVYK